MDNLHIFSILLFSVSTNLDNYGVGVAYGIRNVCVPFKTNAFIAFVNAMGTLFSMLIGERLYNFIQPETADSIGSLLFVSAGCWLIVTDIVGKMKNQKPKMEIPIDSPDLTVVASSAVKIMTMSKPVLYCRYCDANITIKEGILMAFALTFSNLVTGVGAALIGLNTAISVCLVFILGMLALALGVKTGGCAGGRWLEGRIDIIAGLLLILIGIYEYAL